MSDSTDNGNNNSSTSPQSSGPRRSSFASQALADIFGTTRPRPSMGASDTTSSTSGTSGTSGTVGSFPGSVTSAAASAQRRRMSLSGLGLHGANGANGLGGFKRTGSVSSHNSGTIDESAVEDGEPLSAQDTPSTPFGRRMSFGARALRDVKTSTSPGGGGGSGGGGGTNDNSYNWADNFRSRAERSASIASQTMATSPNTAHHRAKSVATMQPPPVQQPQPRPIDHMQERILKGDFYMD